MTIAMAKDKLKIEYVSLDSIKLNPKNPRKNDAAVDKILGSIEQFGFTNPILVRKADNTIIAGHTRFKALKKRGAKIAPVVFLDMTEKQADAYMLADNKLSELADWDDAGVAKLIAELQVEGIDIPSLGFDQSEIDELLQSFDVIPKEDGFGSMPDKPEFQQITFTLHDSQVGIVNEAMKRAKAQDCSDGTNENSNGNALCFICRAFNGQS